VLAQRQEEPGRDAAVAGGGVSAAWGVRPWPQPQPRGSKRGRWPCLGRPSTRVAAGQEPSAWGAGRRHLESRAAALQPGGRPAARRREHCDPAAWRRECSGLEAGARGSCGAVGRTRSVGTSPQAPADACGCWPEAVGTGSRSRDAWRSRPTSRGGAALWRHC
jgi:hypothetical protein